MAKTNTDVSREKEAISMAISSSFGNGGTNFKQLDKVALDENLKASFGEGNYKLIDDIEEEEAFYVKVGDRYYEIDENRNIELIKVTGGIKNLTLICKNSNNEILLQKNYLILKDQYSKTLPNLNGFVPEQEKITGTITEDTEITVMYYWAITEDQLVFTGLDASGNITTDESKIVSYMIGNGSTTNGNGIKVVPTTLSTLKIPETYNGKNVTKIGKYAFYNITKVENIIISDSVKIVGEYAFCKCSVKQVIIENGLEMIEDWGFSQCDNLKKIIYNNENNIFDKNSNIFNGCNKWMEIAVNDDNKKFKVINNVLYSKDEKTIIRVPVAFEGGFNILDGVEVIEANAFSKCDKITEITMASSVKEIKEYAFARCNNLTTFTIGSGVTTVGDWSFYQCSNFKKIIYNNENNIFDKNSNIFYECNKWMEIAVNDDNKKFKVINNVLYSKDEKTIIRVPVAFEGGFNILDGVEVIEANAFSSCAKITEITMASSVKEIKEYAFARCNNLTTFTIGSGVTTVGDWSFYQCTNLKKIIYNSNNELLNAASNVFHSCNKWTEIEVNEENTAYKVVNNILYTKDGKKLVKVPIGYEGDFAIPNEIEEVAAYSFARCDKITNLIVGNDVSKIGKYAFYNCGNIRNITINSSVDSLGELAFYGCSNLIKVIYNNETGVINSSAKLFYLCNKWTEIEVNEENTAYKVINNVLYSKDGSKIIKVPTGYSGNFTVNNIVTAVEKNAFSSCNVLTGIVLSTNITKIELSAFNSCNKLSSIIIPINVNSIGNTAFGGCSALKTVTIDSSTIATGLTAQNSMGYLINNATVIYVKNGVTPGSYVTSNYDNTTSDKSGYQKYIKK